MRLTRLTLAPLAAACAMTMPIAPASASPVDAALLPDLVQEPPSRLEIQQAGARFRLGFRSGVNNAGTAPLVLEARRAHAGEPTMAAGQVLPAVGGAPVVRRGAGTLRYVRWPGHRHWHLEGFERYELRRAGAAAPLRGARKTGFCLGDRYDADRFRRLPGEPRTLVFEQQCGLDRPDLLSLRQGISVGHGDEYDPHLEGQYVDVTGLSPGVYELVHRVNADGALLESRYDNNAACIGVRLEWPRGASRRPAITTTSCNEHKDHKEVGS